MTGLSAIKNGTVNIPYTKLDAGIGSATQDWNGTIPFVNNLNTGTINRLNGGSIVVTAGTVNAGTILPFSILHPAEFATVVIGTGTATGTVKSAVAGSIIYVTNAVISAGTATTNIGLSSGTPTVNNVLGTLTFAANGGLVAMPINPPWRTTSGSALVWSQSGTSNVSLTIAGYVN